MYRSYVKSDQDLGPVVDQLNGKDIRANQIQRRGFTWQNGYGTPSDGHDTSLGQKPVRKLTKDAKSIIIFWSRSGSTAVLASQIERITNADVLEVTLKEPYSANYQETLSRAEYERQNHRPPSIQMDMPDLSQYDRVYFGYQTWAMTMSQPMQSFLEQYGQLLSGKEIALFESEGGYGAGNSEYVAESLIKEAGGHDFTIISPLVVDGNKVDKAEKKVTNWINRL